MSAWFPNKRKLRLAHDDAEETCFVEPDGPTVRVGGEPRSTEQTEPGRMRWSLLDFDLFVEVGHAGPSRTVSLQNGVGEHRVFVVPTHDE